MKKTLRLFGLAVWAAVVPGGLIMVVGGYALMWYRKHLTTRKQLGTNKPQ